MLLFPSVAGGSGVDVSRTDSSPGELPGSVEPAIQSVFAGKGSHVVLSPEPVRSFPTFLLYSATPDNLFSTTDYETVETSWSTKIGPDCSNRNRELLLLHTTAKALLAKIVAGQYGHVEVERWETAA